MNKKGRRQPLEWLTSICPICGEEYKHLANYKPVACSNFKCVQEAWKRGIKNDNRNN